MTEEKRKLNLSMVELETAIDFIHARDGIVFTDYQDLANRINSAFKYNIIAEDIVTYYESVFYIESLDRQVQMSCLSINY